MIEDLKKDLLLARAAYNAYRDAMIERSKATWPEDNPYRGAGPVPWNDVSADIREIWIKIARAVVTEFAGQVYDAIVPPRKEQEEDPFNEGANPRRSTYIPDRDD